MEPESTAPAEAQEQAISTPGAENGQATPSEPSTGDSFTEIDPSTLPPEVQELWNKTYKSLQGDYTKKMQAIAEIERKATAYEELMPQVQDLLKGNQPAPEAPQEPQMSGEELLTRILEDPSNLQKMIQEEAAKLVNPLYDERASQAATEKYNELVAKYPDLPQYEDKIAELVEKGYDPEDAYRAVTYDSLLQKGIDKGIEAAKHRDEAASPKTSNAPVQSNRKVRSVEEAFERAKEQTGWQG